MDRGEIGQNVMRSVFKKKHYEQLILEYKKINPQLYHKYYS